MLIDDEFNSFLKDYDKLIIMGVGNELKADDGVGPFIIKKLFKEEINNNNVILINGVTAPENFTGKIKKENPSHLIIIDACLMGENPGTVKIVNRENFVNVGLSTHSMSLDYFIKYLELDLSFEVLFIGIEPETMELSNKLSKKVESNALKLKDIIYKGIK